MPSGRNVNQHRWSRIGLSVSSSRGRSKSPHTVSQIRRNEMLSRRTLLQSAALASVAMPYLPKVASADDTWPAREIHSICGFPPGSGADVFVRFYSKKLEDKLG